jgi:ABC-type transport system substrate-binding protein
MNKKIMLCVFMLVFLASCIQIVKIGTVEKLTPTVEAGPSSGMVIVDSIRDLISNDTIHVFGGHGKARVTLISGSVVLELYNNTTGSTSVSGSTQAIAYLTQGGLRTTVTSGSSCLVQVPGGGQFTILGTDMFVIYDPDTRYATAGNFGGKVLWSPDGKAEQVLEDKMMVDIAPDGSSQTYPFPFDSIEFQQMMDSTGSPIQGLRLLRDRYNIPQIPSGKPQSAMLALVSFDGDTMLPGLAQSWDINYNQTDSRTLYIFHLTPNVQLINGGIFNSTLVADTMKMRASADAMNGVQTNPVDDYTISFSIPKGAEINLLHELARITYEVQP